MTNPLPTPDELWANVPPGAQAAIAAVFLATEKRTVELDTRFSDLVARLKLNATSSDGHPGRRKPVDYRRWTQARSSDAPEPLIHQVDFALPTVVATCRQQDRENLDCRTICLRADRHRVLPARLPVTTVVTHAA